MQKNLLKVQFMQKISGFFLTGFTALVLSPAFIQAQSNGLEPFNRFIGETNCQAISQTDKFLIYGEEDPATSSSPRPSVNEKKDLNAPKFKEVKHVFRTAEEISDQNGAWIFISPSDNSLSNEFYLQLKGKEGKYVMMSPATPTGTLYMGNIMDGKAAALATWRAYTGGTDNKGQSILYFQSKAFPDYWLGTHRQKGYVIAEEDKSLTASIGADKMIPLPVPKSSPILKEWHVRCVF